MAKDARRTEPEAPAALGVDLASASTAGEAYDRVVRAWDEGKLTTAQARVAVEFLKVRSTVVAAEEFRKRMELLEASAREARRAAVLGPARAATVTMEPEPEPQP